MKKLLTVLLSVLLMISVVNAEGKEKVKVYMFEAGGCPFCEAEEEYLKGLEGYNKTFKLIKKQLYVDHVNWEFGEDFELGKSVAETFKAAGFEDASYEGTPFVVISDLYAAAAYSEELEDYINAAYEEGDKDAVSCINDGGTNCVREIEPSEDDKSNSKAANSTAGIVVAVLGGIAFVGAIVYVVTKKHEDIDDTVAELEDEEEVIEDEEEIDEDLDEDLDEEDDSEEETEEEEVEEVVKVAPKKAKKTTAKKTTTKKTTRARK